MLRRALGAQPPARRRRRIRGGRRGDEAQALHDRLAELVVQPRDDLGREQAQLLAPDCVRHGDQKLAPRQAQGNGARSDSLAERVGPELADAPGDGGGVESRRRQRRSQDLTESQNHRFPRWSALTTLDIVWHMADLYKMRDGGRGAPDRGADRTGSSGHVAGSANAGITGNQAPGERRATGEAAVGSPAAAKGGVRVETSTLETRTRRRGITIERRFTRSPEGGRLDPIEGPGGQRWERRSAVITGEAGEVVFEQRDVEVPASWSQLATNVVASKYFRGPLGTPERESSVKQLLARVVGAIR